MKRLFNYVLGCVSWPEKENASLIAGLKETQFESP